jgi:hypothetical protein
MSLLGPAVQKLFASIVCAMAVSVISCGIGLAAEIGLSRQPLAGANPPVTVAAIIISGQIVDSDAGKVAGFLADARRADDGRQILRLLIHSPGGLAGEAMAIGRLVRSNDVEVFVPQNASCISACVLILAGGARRTIDGQVGIDLPHFLRPAGPRDDVPALLAETRQAMRTYFQSMGVAQELADAMFSLPAGEVHFLSRDEFAKYRLR